MKEFFFKKYIYGRKIEQIFKQFISDIFNEEEFICFGASLFDLEFFFTEEFSAEEVSPKVRFKILC